MAHRIAAIKRNQQGEIVAMQTEDGAIHALPLSISNMQAGDYLGVQSMAESMGGGYVLQSGLGIAADGKIEQLPEFE